MFASHKELSYPSYGSNLPQITNYSSRLLKELVWARRLIFMMNIVSAPFEVPETDMYV
jgi:hypothetical protein